MQSAALRSPSLVRIFLVWTIHPKIWYTIGVCYFPTMSVGRPLDLGGHATSRRLRDGKGCRSRRQISLSSTPHQGEGPGKAISNTDPRWLQKIRFGTKTNTWKGRFKEEGGDISFALDAAVSPAVRISATARTSLLKIGIQPSVLSGSRRNVPERKSCGAIRTLWLVEHITYTV